MLLQDLGYDVLLIGRTTSSSKPLGCLSYETYRMKLPFERGPMFYVSYAFSLFFHLLFRKSDLFFSNDLDTLLPNFVVSRIKRKPLIYDSHEFFTEVPELVGRPKTQTVWKLMEMNILPKVKNSLTVSNSIAQLYREEYGIKMKVLRNVPLQRSFSEKKREELGLPTDVKIVILQGSGINIDRGAEEAIEAMSLLDGAMLLIVGSGDVIESLKQRVKELAIESKVIFKDRMPYDEMMAHTRVADLGLTLDKDTNVNYRYSLPNKLFDYIHAGIPTLASDLKEVRGIIEEYEVGEVVDVVEPSALASKIDQMLGSTKFNDWKQNCLKAQKQLTWNKESQVLRELIRSIDE